MSLVLTWQEPALGFQTPAPGAVNAQTLKLPSGPASVSGLADAPAIGIFTGEVSQSVPIELPQGPAQFGPKLSLTYSGELGYGVLGVGWSVSEFKIVRSLRHGVPSYTDADELDLIGLGDNGRLVQDATDPDLFWAEGQLHGVRVQRSGQHFVVTDANGTRYLLGGSSDARQENEGKVAVWYVEQIENVAGQKIAYHYTNAEGHVYLDRIEWGPKLENGQPAYAADFVYEARPDPVVKLTTGFAEQITSRLTRISVGAFGAPLRTYVLGYEDVIGDPSLPFSRLRSIQELGSDGTTSMPTLSFSYARPEQPRVVAYDAGGWVLNERGVSVADVDGDGMADLLRLEAGNHEFLKAHDTVFSEHGFLSGASDVDLESSALIDLDGDARAELVRIVDDTWRAYRLEGTSWQSLGEVAGTKGIPLSGPGVQLGDLNGDGRTDVVRASTGGLLVNFATATGLAPTVSLPPISGVDLEVEPGTAGVRFTDVNGDKLEDVVWLAPDWMKIFLGRGDGTFVAFNRVPYPWSNQVVDEADLLLGDLNRDGLMDLVRVEAGHVTWYRGDTEGRPSNSYFRRLDPPTGAPADAVVALADLNGNGSLDVVWSSASGLWALDFAGTTTAGMLTGTDNGLGMTTAISYASSASLAVAAERAGDPWNVLLPETVPVPVRMETHFADGTPTRAVEYLVRDGFWDGVERRFGGFLVSVKTTVGSTLETTLVDEAFYQRGLGDDRELRGKTWFTQRTTGSGSLLQTTRTDWKALPAGVPPLMRKPAMQKTSAFEYEGAAEPIEARTTFGYDAEVRPTLERSEGRVDMTGDEKIVRRTYVDDSEHGVRDKICRETTLEGDDATVRSDVRMRYGSDTELFDVCTRAGNGWLRETESHLLFDAEDRWVLQQQASYDAFGNRVDTFESGVRRHVEYDTRGLFALTESVAPSDTRLLSWIATWDQVQGQPLTLTAPDGQVRTFEYDPLGRLSSVRMNAAEPHVHYVYDWRAPLPRTTTFTCDVALSACSATPGGSGWREVTNVSDGAGEALYSATRLGSRWIINDYARRDERGQETLLADPFYSDALELGGPPAPDVPVTTARYDALLRLVRRDFPNGSSKQIRYGAFTQTVSGTERSDVTSLLDGLGRVVHTERTTDDIVEGADATYDAAGRLTSMVVSSVPPATGQATGTAEQHFRYDSLGRLRTADDSDVGLRTYDYDDRNLLVRQTNAAGQVLHFDYDGAGRMIRQGEGAAFDDAKDFLFTYDDPAVSVDASCPVQNRLARVKEPSGEVHFCYDAFGNETTVARTIAPTGAPSRTAVEFREFGASGLLLRVRHDDGLDLGYTYDAAGRAVRIGDYWHADTDGDIDASGRVVREHYGNGAEQVYDYDALGLTRRITLNSGAQKLYDVTIARNAYGAPTEVDDLDGVGLDHQASYDYDGDTRLRGSTLGRDANRYQFSYRYDGLQNMIERGASGPRALAVLAGTYRYGETGLGSGPRQLTSILPPEIGSTPITFQYDAAGREVRDGDATFVYNAFDQLARATPAAPSSAVEYTYGYDGSRTSSLSAGDVTYWFSPTLQEHAGRREHYLKVGDRLVAHLTLQDPASGSAATAPVPRPRVGEPESRWHGLLVLVTLALAGAAFDLRRRGRLAGTGVWRRWALRLACAVVSSSVLGCEMFETLGSAQANWAIVDSLYLHQGVDAGPALLTNGAGVLAEERRYEPFGGSVDALRDGVIVTPDFDRESFNGLNKQTDTRTGLSYHGMRWLAPRTARWLSPDPLVKAPDPKRMAEPWQTHPYQYASQNPMVFWDPDGAEPVGVTTTYLRQLAAARKIFKASDPQVVQNQKAGAAFEALAIKLDPSALRNTKNIFSESRALATKFEVLTMRPDGMADNFGFYQFRNLPFPLNMVPVPVAVAGGYFLEAKAEKGTLFLNSHDYQIQGLLDIAARRAALGGPTGVGYVVFYTTADTIIDDRVVRYAQLRGVVVAQRTLTYDSASSPGFSFSGAVVLTPRSSEGVPFVYKNGKPVEFFDSISDMVSTDSADLESGKIDPADPDPTELN